MNTFTCYIHTGIIKEEAEVRVGGEAKVVAAVLRGQVRKQGERGREFYYFPRINLGAGREFTAEECVTQKQ